MGKKRSTYDDPEPVELTPVETSVAAPIDDAVLLKVDHTHAGKKYIAGTPLEELDASDGAIAYMKEHSVI